MNVLYLYESRETHTNTVFEHLASFYRYSKFSSYYCHQDASSNFNVNLVQFDAVIIHYSIRLPYDQISDSTARAIEQYSGLKVLFIQDEYDHTHRAWYWIKRLGIQLVFTVVPPTGISRVYPPEEFPCVRFVSNLTGYVPEDLSGEAVAIAPSKRALIVGYRGRPLPIHYGQLGQEKVWIGQLVKQYCKSKGICNDIAWIERARIYGPKWYEFMASCRSMLGSESGSNVFDWDGTLKTHIENFKHAHPASTDDDVYREVVLPCEMPGLMNQVSPRIFEAIAAHTVLVLFEGCYSGVVSPGLHYLPLKKDGSNLDEVFTLLEDGKFVDEITERAYQDVIASGKYSYKAFVRMVDEQIAQSVALLDLKPQLQPYTMGSDIAPLTRNPIRAAPPPVGFKYWTLRFVYLMWQSIPIEARARVKPGLKRLLGRE